MNVSLKLSLFILHTAAVPLSPFVCATERNSLNENEDADQRFSVSRQQNTPKTYLPAASPRAPLRPVSVAVWKKGINTFTFRCNQTKCRTTEFVSSILNSLLSLSSLNSSTPSPFKLVDFPSALSLSLSPSSFHLSTQRSYFPSAMSTFAFAYVSR